MTRYQLIDTFNKKIISNHRSPEAAGRAARAHDRAVKLHNGNQSYIPLSLYEKSIANNSYELCTDEDAYDVFNAVRSGY